jgi:hypothetical protein
MLCMNIWGTRRRRLAMMTLACTLAGLGLSAQRLGAEESQEPKEERPVIPWSQASQHIGEEVTIEGRIVATHASPLSTLLSFDPSFNKFTAVIRPGDGEAFPPKPEEYYRGKQVRITGVVVEYEKKAEIVLKNRGQIQILEPQAPPAPVAEKGKDTGTSELTLELIERLAAIESKLDTVTSQLDLIITAVEQPAQPQPEPPRAARPLPGQILPTEPPPRPRYEALRSLKRGMRAAEVEKLIGAPAYIDSTSEGGEVWYYGAGRTVSFDRRGRIQAMAGFQSR